MNKTYTRYRNTIESPNDIKDSVHSILHVLELPVPNQEADLKTFEKQRYTDKHVWILKTLVEDLCRRFQMPDSEIDEYISSVFGSKQDSVTVEINLGKFGRAGVEIRDGRSDEFSNTEDVYQYTLPDRGHNASVEAFRKEFEKGTFNDDGVAISFNFQRLGDEFQVEAYKFDRPNESLLERDRSSNGFLNWLL
jgi:hypothetical protein